MSITCTSCGTSNVPGALLCAACSTPLVALGALPGATPTSAPAATPGASPAPAPLAPVIPLPAVGSASVGPRASALAVLERGAPGAKVIELPQGDFALTLGRHDLVSSPPVVVDVDLTEYCAPVQLASGAHGYAVSRRHCVLRRDHGALSLTSAPGALTLVRAPGAADFAPTAAGLSQALAVGARIVFGAQSPLIVEVV